MGKRLRFTGIALIISAVLALVFISVYAVSGRDEDGRLQGRVLIWHSYEGAEAEALEEMLNRFRNIHPSVTVMQQSFLNPTVLQEEYANAVNTGLGPDIIIGPSSWIAAFAPANQIAPIDAQLPDDVWQRYTTSALDVVTYQEHRYALPLALNTLGLYYNRQLISNAISTTDALERDAAQGAVVLMSTTFRDAYWGINAFGGQVFAEDQSVVLDQGGFANWLAWLANLRNYPGVILDNNRDALRARFIEGDAAYYVGYASELSIISEALGLENIGVGPLPAGPIANAQPLLEVTGFMFSPVSSNNQRKLALELTQFLSNAEQSGALMRRVRSVPANLRVRINPRLNPIVSSFATQARAAAPLVNTPEMEAALRLGGEAYLRVLDGGIPPAEAATATTIQINEAIGRDVLVAQTQTICTNLGTVRLLHTWEGQAADALEQLIDRYRNICPNIIVDAEYESPANIPDRLRATTPGLTRAYTILGSSDLFQLLINDDAVIRELTPYVTSELLQRFQPNALDTMRYQRVIYGLPLALELNILYFNRRLVDSPALTTDDLRAQSGQAVQIELDVNFEPAFWGVSAYGGRLFDNENRVILDQGGMDDWLAWLRESRESFGINLTTDSALLRNRFESGQIGYYIGSSAELAGLQAAMGPDNLGVAPLPDGPGGNAYPLLSGHGFFLSQAGSETQAALALDFIQFATSVENQIFLAETTGLVPVNANVDLNNGSVMEILLETSRNATAPPNTFHMQTVRELGSAYYQRVLDQNESPELVVAEVTAAINERNGVAPLPTPAPTPIPPVPTVEPDATGNGIILEGEDPDMAEEMTGDIQPEDGDPLFDPPANGQ